MLYQLLTSLIIMIGRLRDRLCSHKYALRCDRTLPWTENPKAMSMICCDCGLTHFIVAGQTVTPIRPITYDYRGRMGAVGWTEPDEGLGNEVCDMYMDWHPRKNYQVHNSDGDRYQIYAPNNADWRRSRGVR